MIPCCDLHREVGCCDPNDCGPCCPECPTCPTLERGRRLERALRVDAPALSRVGVHLSSWDRWRCRWWTRLGRHRRAQRIILRTLDR